jgi:uncharacterized membrane protein
MKGCWTIIAADQLAWVVAEATYLNAPIHYLHFLRSRDELAIRLERRYLIHFLAVLTILSLST